MFCRYIALTACPLVFNCVVSGRSACFLNSILLELLMSNFETDNVIYLFRILLIEGLSCLKSFLSGVREVRGGGEGGGFPGVTLGVFAISRTLQLC